MVKFRQFIKEKENQKEKETHDKYLKGCEEENNKRKEKEDKWYNYYRNFDKNLNQKMSDYESKYVVPKIIRA